MSLRRSQSESRMRAIRTSGLMSGDGKRGCIGIKLVLYGVTGEVKSSGPAIWRSMEPNPPSDRRAVH